VLRLLEMNETEVQAGKYTFKIIENKLEYGGLPLSYTLKIGGDYDRCVSVSYSFRNGVPISATLAYLHYEPECSIGSTLVRDTGSVFMIKTLLRFAYHKIKDVHLFTFDDMSHIAPRHPGRPLKLAFFLIAYHDMTWYEKNFNATMIDKEKYLRYRQRVLCLTNKEEKAKVDYQSFLEIIKAPANQHDILKTWYESSATYRDFFNKIPKDVRCDMLLPWLHNFMTHFIGDVFSDKGWEIDIHTMNKRTGGHTNRTRKHSKRSKRIRTHSLFPSNYHIIHYEEMHTM